MSLPEEEIAWDLFGDPNIEIEFCREGSWIAYTEDYDLWFADRFRVQTQDQEFYIWAKDGEWGVIES